VRDFFGRPIAKRSPIKSPTKKGLMLTTLKIRGLIPFIL